MRKFIFEKRIKKILIKLERKDKSLYEQLKNKINEIMNSNNVEHYKNLKNRLKEFKRVHVGHFVLVFRYDKKEDLIIFDDFDHHDKIYW